jgi:VWFA-related protein
MRTGEQITVERILVDARVTDFGGEPILGLTAADFEVRIDGKPAAVESVLWIPETAAARAVAGIDEEEYRQNQTIGDVPAPLGRLFVYFVQTDFARNASRTAGQMHFFPYAEKMIDALEEGDRVAVLSFDSHLKFRLDFTDRKGDIMNALTNALLVDEPPPPPVVPSPSLARRLDREEMKRCTSSDEAFILLANALRHIPGPKSMILFGWGLGIRSGRTVVMHKKYPIAKYALDTARVTVFALDMTMADYHDLEIGLQKAAADTGGFYAKTHEFPQIAVNRLERTLAGHYELEVRKPQLDKPGTHRIDVRVKRRGAHVMARSSYQDKPE